MNTPLAIPHPWQNWRAIVYDHDAALFIRRLHLSKAEKWDKKSFNGDEIGGKTLGLLGVGNIGGKLPNAQP